MEVVEASQKTDTQSLSPENNNIDLSALPPHQSLELDPTSTPNDVSFQEHTESLHAISGTTFTATSPYYENVLQSSPTTVNNQVNCENPITNERPVRNETLIQVSDSSIHNKEASIKEDSSIEDQTGNKNEYENEEKASDASVCNDMLETREKDPERELQMNDEPVLVVSGESPLDARPSNFLDEPSDFPLASEHSELAAEPDAEQADVQEATSSTDNQPEAEELLSSSLYSTNLFSLPPDTTGRESAQTLPASELNSTRTEPTFASNEELLLPLLNFEHATSSSISDGSLHMCPSVPPSATFDNVDTASAPGGPGTASEPESELRHRKPTSSPCAQADTFDGSSAPRACPDMQLGAKTCSHISTGEPATSRASAVAQPVPVVARTLTPREAAADPLVASAARGRAKATLEPEKALADDDADADAQCSCTWWLWAVLAVALVLAVVALVLLALPMLLPVLWPCAGGGGLEGEGGHCELVLGPLRLSRTHSPWLLRSWATPPPT